MDSVELELALDNIRAAYERNMISEENFSTEFYRLISELSKAHTKEISDGV